MVKQFFFFRTDDVDNNNTVHILIGAPSHRLTGLTALVNSIQSNTNASLKFHLVTNKEGADHLSIWMDTVKLQAVKREIIIFNNNWIRGRILLSQRGRRWKEFSDPVSCM